MLFALVESREAKAAQRLRQLCLEHFFFFKGGGSQKGEQSKETSPAAAPLLLSPYLAGLTDGCSRLLAQQQQDHLLLPSLFWWVTSRSSWQHPGLVPA